MCVCARIHARCNRFIIVGEQLKITLKLVADQSATSLLPLDDHQNQPAGHLCVVNALACHRCDPGSNPGIGMWPGSGRSSKVGGCLRFPPPRMITERQHPRLRVLSALCLIDVNT